MGFENYFTQEMVALRELAAEAVESNPALASTLKTPGLDQDIEKLFESFAFLTSKLKLKIDDELPEITHGLFDIFWPYFLRTQPAVTVMQFSPTANTTGSNRIPPGIYLESAPVDNTVCIFRTAYETEVLPLHIDQKRHITRDGKIGLAVSFSLTNGILGNLPLYRLRLFFSGEEKLAFATYFSLLKQLQCIRFVVRDNAQKKIRSGSLGPSAIQAVGFSDDEALLPYPDTLHPAYRILTEYFYFHQKFMFLDICGLDACITDEVASQNNFELQFEFSEPPEFYEDILATQWRLHCTPAVNLFPLTRVPVAYPTSGTKICLRPNNTASERFSIFSVENVRSWPEESKSEITYRNISSFHSFQIIDFPAYKISVEQTLHTEETNLYIELLGKTQVSSLLEVDIICTNGKLPEKLRIGEITSWSEQKESTAIEFKNILPVSASIPPPIQDGLLWKILSDFSPNICMVQSSQALAQTLSVYNFRARYDNLHALKTAHLMEGIKKVSFSEADRIFAGKPIRGMTTRLLMDPSHFGSRGAMYLFGLVVNEFLTILATRHSFHKLEILDTAGNIFSLPERFNTHLFQ